VNDFRGNSRRFSLFARRGERYIDSGRDCLLGGIDMRASAFRALAAAALASLAIVSAARAGDWMFDPRCGPVHPMPVRVVPVHYPSPYACTEPAPPSQYPPVPISDPFGCVGPYCPPTSPYGGDPYRREPIPLPNPPGSYGTFPYSVPPYGGTPYGTPPYGTPPYGTPPGTSPFGSPPGSAPLTPGTAPLTPGTPGAPGRHPGGGRPIISQSSTLGGVTKYIEAPTELCKVSFWNQTGNDITLIVGDRTNRIQKDRAVVLSLPRDFSWKTDATADKREQIPSDLNFFDVVIR
jgi:hypothetical protein